MRFRSDPARVRGSIAPIVTPFTADGEVDHDGIRALVRWQLEAGSHGISIGGSTGEPSAQTVAERIAAMRVVAEEVGRPCAVRARHRIGQARRDAGADAGGDRPRRRHGAGDHALLLAADPGGAVPVVLGGRRRRSRRCRSSSTTCRSAPPSTSPPRRSPGCAAPTTTSSGSRRPPRTSSTSPASSTSAAATSLMWSGIELLCLPLLALGGIGFVSAVANIAPTAVAEMYDALGGGRHRARRSICTTALHPLVDLMFVETNPAPIKHVLAPGGLIASGYVRPPLVEPTPSGDRRRSSASLVEGGALLARAARPIGHGFAGRPDDAPPTNGHPQPRSAPRACRRRSATTSAASTSTASTAHVLDVTDPVTHSGVRHARRRQGGRHRPRRRPPPGTRSTRVGLGRACRPQRSRCAAVRSPTRSRRGPTRSSAFEAFDTGLPVTQARGQAARAAENFRYFADVCRRDARGRLPHRGAARLRDPPADAASPA